MSAQVGVTTLHSTVPYITMGVFKAWPTSMPLDALTSGGTPQQQDEQLSRMIFQASREVNSYCYGATQGTLSATKDTEQYRTRLDRYGRFLLNPRFTPVIALESISWGNDPAAMSAITDLTHCEVETHRIVVPAYPFTGMSSAGPVQFGIPAAPSNFPLLVQFTYTNGFPLTTLTGAVTAGATSITVNDATGIYNGTVLTIRDAVNGDERITVTAPPSGTTLTCTALASAHTPQSTYNPIQVDGLPEDIIDACVELTMGLLKRRMANTKNQSKSRSFGPEEESGAAGDDNFDRGYDLLDDYVQVRDR